MSDPLPGNGFLGWLGRQVGYVSKAVKTKPAEVPPKPLVPAPKVIYRDNKVEEAEHPTQPGVKLRRTIIDEVVVDDRNRRETGDERAKE